MYFPLDPSYKGEENIPCRPKNAEWTAQRDPADPRETKTILKKKEKKILDEPLQDEAT